MYQIGLGGIQVIGKQFGGKFGLFLGYAAVLLWTFAKTYNGLFVLQLLIQTGVGLYLLATLNEED